MSNYHGRKTEFTPTVYPRYFERTETRKSPNGHLFFNDNEEELSTNYQTKRDLLFKRLFPSKYADSDNNQTESAQIHQNGNNRSSTTQSLGDYISLSNDNPSTQTKRPSSPQADVVLSSSDDNEDDLLIEEQLLPNSRHESIVGHVHPRSTIENVRAILIRELYERTSDPHTEWLKCKMNIPKGYINPKYYADFQRRYKKEIQRNSTKKNQSNSSKNNSSFFDLSRTSTTTTTTTTTTQINLTSENDDVIETSPIVPSTNPPAFIILDSDDDDDLVQDPQFNYFIDRSSTSLRVISQSASTSNEDYQKEDSKYAQLPTRPTSSPTITRPTASPTITRLTSSSTIIRPILSKHQRRKKVHSTTSSTPLVSAIDRIIDHMDQSDIPQTMEQENLLVKQIKKRKKKKKKKLSD